MTKVYDIVIRVSRRNGREGETFISPDEQLKIGTGWVESVGARVGMVHDETDSVSGGTVERVGLKLALARAVEGKTDGIVVAKVDRFARTLEGGLKAVRELEDAGREFIAVADGLTGGASEKRNPTAKLLRGILFLLAEWQRDSLTASWEVARENHVRRGVHGVARFGYRKANGKGSKLVPDPDEALIVVAVFGKRAARWSWPRIAEWLNEQGVAPRRATHWTAARVKDIVESRVYLGEARSGDFVNPTAHEPIVTAELWEAANALRSREDRRASGDFLLTGLVRCASCGVRMAGQDSRHDPHQRRYRCRRRHGFGACPAPVSVAARELEPLIEAEFIRRFMDVELDGARANDELDQAMAELEAAKVELRRYRDDPSRVALEEIGEYEGGMQTRIARVREAQEHLGTVRAQATGLLVPDDLADRWPSLTLEEKRTLLAEGFDAVLVKAGAGGGTGRRGPAVAIDQRVKVFGRGEAPADLPGKGAGAALRAVSF